MNHKWDEHPSQQAEDFCKNEAEKTEGGPVNRGLLNRSDGTPGEIWRYWEGSGFRFSGSQETGQQVNNGNAQNKSNKFDCLSTFCGLGRKLSAFQPQFYLTLMTTI